MVEPCPARHRGRREGTRARRARQRRRPASPLMQGSSKACQRPHSTPRTRASRPRRGRAAHLGGDQVVVHAARRQQRRDGYALRACRRGGRVSRPVAPYTPFSPLNTHTNPNCCKHLNLHSHAADAAGVRSLLTQCSLDMM